jgi:hypothetical protein
MRVFRAWPLVAASLVAPSASDAQAQLSEVLCQPTPELRQTLATRFGVTRSAGGMRSPGQMMELWQDEGGDWALVARYASGRSCVLAYGAHWSGPPPGG